MGTQDIVRRSNENEVDKGACLNIGGNAARSVVQLFLVRLGGSWMHPTVDPEF